MIKFSDMTEKEASKLEYYCRKNKISCNMEDSEFEDGFKQINITGDKSPVVSCYDDFVILAYNNTSFMLNKSDFYKMEVL